MLNKIGLFTFLEAVGLTIAVGQCVPRVGRFLDSIGAHVKVFSIDLPLLAVLPAVVLALVSRIFRLHDKLSDLFRIRKNFDVFRILLPLALAVGCAPAPNMVEALQVHRKRIIARTFYRYASFEDPKISKAAVLSAIDVWTWYWILAEFLFLLGLTTSVFISFGYFGPAAYSLVAFSLLSLTFSTYFSVCGKKVDYQIDEIVSDSKRVEQIRGEFASLLKTDVK